ncbi:TetR/AcrR family transcriptional regulator [Coraliomargarita sp. SDUM461004]|uniref:TetR/AcrR family transcriptional regulator n=1 Tax=Thalassobacterium sedimentorum TaxID=3041258 RepID=A0ABU1ANF1_9BACT|nr:TetR/AcrR family transcriptional regulator [Coraliomargarita sp. SDUM461004]MDQ8196320.1 TetR/AcrR family transcriptional regulator [Coraliomargarita sp. SDUM461004]
MSKARERLLRSAGRLFGERGYECVGINEIIAQAEIAKATFYQHFPSKEALCAEWLRVEMDQFTSMHQEILDDPRAAHQKVSQMFDQLSVYVEGNGYHGCPFCVTATMVTGDSEIREVIVTYRERIRSFWHSVARELGTKATAARNLGDAWLLLYTGALTESQNVKDVWPVKQAKKAALALAECARV